MHHHHRTGVVVAACTVLGGCRYNFRALTPSSHSHNFQEVCFWVSFQWWCCGSENLNNLSKVHRWERKRERERGERQRQRQRDGIWTWSCLGRYLYILKVVSGVVGSTYKDKMLAISVRWTKISDPNGYWWKVWMSIPDFRGTLATVPSGTSWDSKVPITSLSARYWLTFLPLKRAVTLFLILVLKQAGWQWMVK